MYDMEGFTSGQEFLTLFDEESGEYYTVKNPEYKPPISDDMLKLMWDTVNSAQPDNLDALQEAEQKIDKMFDEVQFDAEIYDELMDTLAYKTREYYAYFNKKIIEEGQ